MPAIRRGVFARMLKHQGWLLDPDAKSSRIFLAIAAFVWALVVATQVWRARQQSRDQEG